MDNQRIVTQAMKSGYEDLLQLLEYTRQECQEVVDNPPDVPWAKQVVAYARFLLQIFDALDTAGFLTLVDDL